MKNDSIGDIEIMINRMVDGELTPDKRAALERQLLRDPEAHAMLRDYEALDSECRDAIGSALAPPAVNAEQSESNRSWAWAISASAAAAAVVLGVVLWSTIIERPDESGGIAGEIRTPAPTTADRIELVTDRFDPTPPAPIMIRPVRSVDRIPVGLYDAETGQMKIILVDREQEQREPQWLDL
ncbi:MAG: hypothetical protein QGG42_11385 [Phycisphaerae bacterium]|jgi:hypothetical protein|nr:hypothetical protein [Phycisphaerae bacterium]